MSSRCDSGARKALSSISGLGTKIHFMKMALECKNVKCPVKIHFTPAGLLNQQNSPSHHP